MPSPTELTAVVRELAPHLKQSGFQRFGLTFNRETEPGLIQVVGMQGNKWGGQFTVNLGIYVREVDQLFDDWWGREERVGLPGRDGVIKEEWCWLRTRLGQLNSTSQVGWWSYDDPIRSASDVHDRLETDADPAFLVAQTRQGLLAWWDDQAQPRPIWRIEPRAPLGFALLLSQAGRTDDARAIVEGICRTSAGKPFFHMVSVWAEELGFECPDP